MSHRPLLHPSRFALLAAACLALTGHAQTVWNLATGYRAESFQTENIRLFAKDVGDATQGKLKIAVHPNNTLYKMGEIRAAVGSGRVEAGEVIMSTLAAEMPLAGADSVPFVVSSYDDARRLWRFQRPKIEKLLQDKGMVLLYAVPWPPQGLYTSAPVSSVGDFKGSRMRTYNPATVRIAELLGAAPVDVPMTEVSRALEAGRIDSMITSSVTGVETDAWKHIRYFYNISAWVPKNIVFANARAFALLDRATQAKVLDAAAEAEKRGWKMSEAAAEAGMAELKRHGMVVATAAPSDLQSDIRRFGERFSREWVRQAGHGANDIFIPYYTQR